MYIFLKEVAVVIFCNLVVSHGLPVNSDTAAVMYLYKYGYLPESDIAASLMPSTPRGEESTLSRAFKYFQKFFGLKETGELDEETFSMMNNPRCGVKDRIGNSQSVRRKRFAFQGHKWRLHITYRITKYPVGIKKRSIVDGEIARAIKVWNDVTTIQLKEAAEGPVDINIRFEAKEHSDGQPFDGPGHILAHSFFPNSGGYIHFDDNENWTVNSSTGINLFQIAAHEVGHALGLAHSDDKKAIMYPVYQKYNPDFKIHSDDIEGLRILYGPQDNFIDPTREDEDEVEEEQEDKVEKEDKVEEEDEEEDTSKLPADNAPDLCKNAAFDTIARKKNGISYIFKGDFYWKYICHKIDDRYPRKISEDWDGLEGNLDASFILKNGSTFFFKGNRYWRFTNKKMDKGYPKTIGSDAFQGIPSDLDAAYVWNKNEKIFFFKGNQVWPYDINSPIIENPVSIQNWDGALYQGIDAAVHWDHDVSYFFKGEKYYKFNDDQFEVAADAKPPYPRPTAQWWFNC